MGANSSSGFYSLFDNFVNADSGDLLWVIKNGPGCGKSDFIKKIGTAAADAAFDVEYIHNCEDPDELDGVYIPALKTGYIDGSAPHIFDVKYPGASGMYLDLGAFYDISALKRHLPDIAEKSNKLSDLRLRAGQLISAANYASPLRYPGLAAENEIIAVKKRADGVIARELPKKHPAGPGAPCVKRFLSALSYKGRVFFDATATSICARIYGLDNTLGMADIFASHIAQAAKSRGLRTIICPDPIDSGRLEALLIPELSLGFLSAEPGCAYEGNPYRHVRLDAMIEKDRIRPIRSKLRRDGKTRSSLLSSAAATLCDAKEVRDELRQIYRLHTDTTGLDILAGIHINRLFP